MELKSKNRVLEILEKYQTELLEDWLQELTALETRQTGAIPIVELRQQAEELLHLLREALQHNNFRNLRAAEWSSMKQMLAEISRSRLQQGFTPSEVANFVFCLKKPVFKRLQQESGRDGNALLEEIWLATQVLDQLGLWTLEVFQQNREEVILRQQQELLELSTPVVKLWEGILALPMIGTLDSARTQVVMESLLEEIVQTGSQVVIIDITGVPTVDTLVAQHLLKTVAAARLMGTDCIISGIRPQIAQTIVHLGVDLSAVITKATLADAFKLALQQQGLNVTEA